MTVDQLGRAYAAYRRTAGSRSLIALLVANAIPLIGVLFFGWSLLTILVIYWLENGIVGFWNVPRILLAQGSIVPTLPPLPDTAAFAATGNRQASAGLQAAWQKARDAQLRSSTIGTVGLARAGRVAIAIFFLMHYGIFWFVHGVFVFTLPMFAGGFAGGIASCVPDGLTDSFSSCGNPFGELLWTNVAIAGIALFLSHGASFLFNYIGRAEYLTASPARQMAAPYGRVVVLHLTILFGAFAIAIFGAPVIALLILVGLKTAFDVALHRRERRAADARVPAETTFGHIVRET